MALELRLLGPLQALRDGEEVPLPGVKLRSVLATLALRAGEAVSVDRLADVLWSDAPPQTLMTQIQAQISTLRRLLDPHHAPGAAGELIETRPPGYRLNADAANIDLDRFEAALRYGREARKPARRALRSNTSGAGWACGGEALADLPREAFGPEDLHGWRIFALPRSSCGSRRSWRSIVTRRHWRSSRRSAWRIRIARRCGEAHDRALSQRQAGRGAGRLSDCPEHVHRGARHRAGERLRDLERAILHHDPALEGRAMARALAASRPVLVAGALDGLGSLTALALAMADTDVIAVGHVAVDADLAQAARAVRAEIAAVGAGAPVRCAAFRSRDVAHDLARLAEEQDAGLVVVSLARGGDLPLELLAACAADVALVRAPALDALETIAVPFAGSTHDWAAVALAGRMAASRGLPLELIGVDAGAAGDASQRWRTPRSHSPASPASKPRLGSSPPPPSPRLRRRRRSWSRASRRATAARGSAAPWAALLDREGCGVVFAHCGPRPGAPAPASSLTRFTWSLAD